MAKNTAFFDRARRGLGDLENDLIDHLLAGRVGRRDFLRHGSILGLSLPFLGTLAGAAGLQAATSRAYAQGTPDAVVRCAVQVPAAAIEPVTIADNGGLLLLHQCGEFLCINGPDLTLIPVLAESWSANDDASVWTFKIRQGVKFQDGRAMKADDVVSTFQRLADPANSSNSLSAFKGVLSKDGPKKVDDFTVAFHLDAPNGNFPYLVSSDNYNSIILPADYAMGDFEKTFIGTGPFRIEAYTPNVGANFVRNEDYWGPKPLPSRVEFLFFSDIPAMVLALQGNQVDIISQIPMQYAQTLFGDPSIEVLSIKSVGHQQVHMRTDMAPFQDKRVRQALALSLDRKKIVAGLLKGRAVVGNDSPFAPLFPSTDTSIPQRDIDINQAKQLLAAAGVPDGFSVTLTTLKYLEIPDYAILIQNAAKAIGINIELNVKSMDAYYGKAVFGESDWLDSVLGITDYGHRGVPNVFLTAPLVSGGSWNSAHFKNADYDKLVADYIKARDLGTQKTAASQIQKLLLDETPIIFGYFFDYLVPVRNNLKGVPLIANRLFPATAYFA
jgi:peptide/nickel transport system substrate-binding protein